MKNSLCWGRGRGLDYKFWAIIGGTNYGRKLFYLVPFPRHPLEMYPSNRQAETAGLVPYKVIRRFLLIMDIFLLAVSNTIISKVFALIAEPPRAIDGARRGIGLFLFSVEAVPKPTGFRNKLSCQAFL